MRGTYLLIVYWVSNFPIVNLFEVNGQSLQGVLQLTAKRKEDVMPISFLWLYAISFFLGETKGFSCLRPWHSI